MEDLYRTQLRAVLREHFSRSIPDVSGLSWVRLRILGKHRGKYSDITIEELDRFFTM